MYYTSGSEHLQSRLVDSLFRFLGDEDARVREAASRAVVSVVGGLYHLRDDRNNDPVVSEVNAMARKLLHPIVSEDKVSRFVFTASIFPWNLSLSYKILCYCFRILSEQVEIKSKDLLSMECSVTMHVRMNVISSTYVRTAVFSKQ